MPKFAVRINERWEMYVQVEAKDATEAVELVNKGEGEILYHEYVEDMDIDVDEVELLDEGELIFGNEENHDGPPEQE